MTSDERFMQEALRLAREAGEAGEVPIGCVITRGDEIIGRGTNCRAISQACNALGGWRLWQCRLYVTLEPCPMCAGAILNARIPTVVYGTADPKAGSIASKVRLFDLGYNHRPEVISGVLASECSDLLREFFQKLRAQKKTEGSWENPRKTTGDD